MIGILTILQQQGLLGTFSRPTNIHMMHRFWLNEATHLNVGGALPFDLERTFSSGFVSTMLTFVDPHDGTYRSFHDQTCHLLDEFVDRGCTPARFRKSEVELLRDMIRQCDAAAEGDTMIRGSTRVGQRPESQHQAPSQERLGDGETLGSDIGAMYNLSPGQILSLAQMVDVEDCRDEDESGWMDGWLWNNAVDDGHAW